MHHHFFLKTKHWLSPDSSALTVSASQSSEREDAASVAVDSTSNGASNSRESGAETIAVDGHVQLGSHIRRGGVTQISRLVIDAPILGDHALVDGGGFRRAVHHRVGAVGLVRDFLAFGDGIDGCVEGIDESVVNPGGIRAAGMDGNRDVVDFAVAGGD